MLLCLKDWSLGSLVYITMGYNHKEQGNKQPLFHRSPMPKRSCAYTQFETASKIYFYLWRLVLWICGISVRILLTALDVASNKIIQSSL